MRIRITPRNRSLYGFVGKLYVLALSHWRVSGVDGRNRLELHFLESALPENSDWISCSGCENSRSSGEKPNFDPKPQKTRNDSSYQSFNIMGHGWEKVTPTLEELPFKGDTVVGNDVWIGQSVTIMPGVHIGDGAIIAANSVVTKDIPPYHIAGGNPIRIIRKRFDDDLIRYLLELKWWDWSAQKVFENLEILCSDDLTKIKEIK